MAGERTHTQRERCGAFLDLEDLDESIFGPLSKL